jgi:transposase-like protein
MEKKIEEKEEKKTCRVCGSTRNVKWGKRKGKQCYRCSDCGFQFTREDERRNEKDVLRAVALYCFGFSYMTIGKILNYHDTTIMRWIGMFADKYCEKPIPKGEIEVELDEMHHFIGSKKTSFGFGKHTIEQVERFLTGRLEIEVPPLLKGCIID